MSARVGFTADDAERQAGDAAANYLNRALRMLAGRLALEKTLERDPAAFATQYAPLLSALIEAQAVEYRSWVHFDRLERIADALLDGFGDVGSVLARRPHGLVDRPDSEATP